jgi:hypothetical protein
VSQVAEQSPHDKTVIFVTKLGGDLNTHRHLPSTVGFLGMLSKAHCGAHSPNHRPPSQGASEPSDVSQSVGRPDSRGAGDPAGASLVD